MNEKIKIIILILAVIILTTAVTFSVSFKNTVTAINKSSVSVSNHGIEKKAATSVVKTSLDLENIKGTDSKNILSCLNENLDENTAEIYSKYIAEVKAAVSTSSANQSNSQVSLGATAVNFNGLEASILNVVNNIRASNGLGALSPNQMLTDLARLRSQDMVARNYFSHYTPEGTNIKNIFAQYGVAYRNFGENLGRSSPAGSGTPDAFGNAWMNSPSHRDNMLKAYYTLIGVGVVDGGGKRVVTVLFIR